MLPQLNTDNLTLREVQLSDTEALQSYQSRSEQWLNTAMEPEEFEDAGLRIKKYFEHRGEGRNQRFYVYVAELTATGKVVGQGSLSRSHPAIASVGFSIAHQHYGKGLATELAFRLLQFGFEDIKLNRIEADVAVQNSASIRVLEKIGMKHEGTIREGIWAQGKWWTEDKYSCLSQEYKRRDFKSPLQHPLY